MSSLMRRVRTFRAPALESAVIAHGRTTRRVLLRPYVMSDLDDWLGIEQDASVRDALGWPTRGTAEAVERLRARTHHTALRHVGDLLVLAAEYEGHVVGDVSLHLRTIAPETRSVEMGWLLRSDARGQGLATEAAGAILDLAFGEAGATLVVAVVAGDNQSSAKLALRLGFRLAASRREASTFVLSREDYAAGSRLTGTERPTSEGSAE